MLSNKIIKNRINSVKNTIKITNAMQMISATKMKKTQTLAKESLPYSSALNEILSLLGKIDDYKSTFFEPITKKKSKACLLVIGSGKGFVGSMNTQLLLYIHNNILNKINIVDTEGVAIQQNGLKILNNLGVKVHSQFNMSNESIEIDKIEPLFNVILDNYNSGRYNKVILAYTHFVNSYNIFSKHIQLLPIKFENFEENRSNKMITLFEPNKEEIMDYLLKEYFQSIIISAMYSNNAAEHSFRMISMKQATDNAQKLKIGLNKIYNKTRQNLITQQMLEIIGGSQ